MNIYEQLLSQDGRLDFSSIEVGDEIKVTARKFIHQPEVFDDIEKETEKISFKVRRKTHPSSSSEVETYLWSSTEKQSSSSHWSLSDTRGLARGSNINWYAEKIEKI